MIIDLSSPFWGAIVSGIILSIIVGTYHYIVTLVKFNYVNKKLGNVLSELDVLNKKYNEDISKIKGQSEKKLDNSLANNINIILKHNKQQRPLTLREALAGYTGTNKKYK